MTAPVAGAELTRRILDGARWAPSGDNTQPWRFERVSDAHIVVHGHDTRADCVYDLRGAASQLSIGALLETIEICASEFGIAVRCTRRNDAPVETPTFDIGFEPDASVATSPLAAMVPVRSVNRRPYRTRSLTPAEIDALGACLPPGFELCWFSSVAERRRIAWLLFQNAELRLTLPEAYEVHRRIIEWNSRFSDDKVPDRALGVGSATLAIMRWAMQSWSRVSFLNRYLAGTWLPRIEMDLLPGLRCSAHLAMCAASAPGSIDDWVAAGRAVQRFWLTATLLGLSHQPEVTPLVFASYIRDGVRFTADGHARQRAAALSDELDSLLTSEVARRSVWLGRIGEADPPAGRSRRLPLDRLWWIP
jgi:nitroreductase